MAKPYLVSLYSKTNNSDKHFYYVDKIWGKDVEKKSVIFERYPGHKKKWEFLPQDLDKDRWAIFTDTDDVLIQRKLPELKGDIYVGNENIRHSETLWADVIKKVREAESLLDETIYNVGCFAMRVPILYEFQRYLMRSEIDHPFADQLCFNMFIQQSKYKVVDNLKYFCPLFANVFVSGVIKQDGWRVDGELISVVHGNGNTKEYLW